MSDELNQEIVLSKAKESYNAGDYLKAAHLYLVAETSLINAGEDARAGAMANNASVSFLRAGENEKSLLVLDGYIDLFESLDEIRNLAFTLGNRAAALDASGRLDEATKDYQRAALLFTQIDENELFAITKQSLSALQIRSGNPLEALATMKSGLSATPPLGIKHRLLKRFLDIPFRLLKNR